MIRGVDMMLRQAAIRVVGLDGADLLADERRDEGAGVVSDEQGECF